MVNGLGVLGWGSADREVRAAMLGEPVTMLILPTSSASNSTGRITRGFDCTDLGASTVTERLRKHGVVAKFVEFYGDGVPKVAPYTGRRRAHVASSTVRLAPSSR